MSTDTGSTSPDARPMSPSARTISPDARLMSRGAKPMSPRDRPMSPDSGAMSPEHRSLICNNEHTMSSDGRPSSRHSHLMCDDGTDYGTEKRIAREPIYAAVQRGAKDGGTILPLLTEPTPSPFRFINELSLDDGMFHLQLFPGSVELSYDEAAVSASNGDNPQLTSAPDGRSSVTPAVDSRRSETSAAYSRRSITSAVDSRRSETSAVDSRPSDIHRAIGPIMTNPPPSPEINISQEAFDTSHSAGSDTMYICQPSPDGYRHGIHHAVPWKPQSGTDTTEKPVPDGYHHGIHHAVPWKPQSGTDTTEKPVPDGYHHGIHHVVPWKPQSGTNTTEKPVPDGYHHGIHHAVPWKHQSGTNTTEKPVPDGYHHGIHHAVLWKPHSGTDTTEKPVPDGYHHGIHHAVPWKPQGNEHNPEMRTFHADYEEKEDMVRGRSSGDRLTNDDNMLRYRHRGHHTTHRDGTITANHIPSTSDRRSLQYEEAYRPPRRPKSFDSSTFMSADQQDPGIHKGDNNPTQSYNRDACDSGVGIHRHSRGESPRREYRGTSWHGETDHRNHPYYPPEHTDKQTPEHTPDHVTTDWSSDGSQQHKKRYKNPDKINVNRTVRRQRSEEHYALTHSPQSPLPPSEEFLRYVNSPRDEAGDKLKEQESNHYNHTGGHDQNDKALHTNTMFNHADLHSSQQKGSHGMASDQRSQSEPSISNGRRPLSASIPRPLGRQEKVNHHKKTKRSMYRSPVKLTMSDYHTFTIDEPRAKLSSGKHVNPPPDNRRRVDIRPASVAFCPQNEFDPDHHSTPRDDKSSQDVRHTLGRTHHEGQSMSDREHTSHYSNAAMYQNNPESLQFSQDANLSNRPRSSRSWCQAPSRREHTLLDIHHTGIRDGYTKHTNLSDRDNSTKHTVNLSTRDKHSFEKPNVGSTGERNGRHKQRNIDKNPVGQSPGGHWQTTNFVNQRDIATSSVTDPQPGLMYVESSKRIGKSSERRFIMSNGQKQGTDNKRKEHPFADFYFHNIKSCQNKGKCRHNGNGKGVENHEKIRINEAISKVRKSELMKGPIKPPHARLDGIQHLPVHADHTACNHRDVPVHENIACTVGTGDTGRLVTSQPVGVSPGFTPGTSDKQTLDHLLPLYHQVEHLSSGHDGYSSVSTPTRQLLSLSAQNMRVDPPQGQTNRISDHSKPHQKAISISTHLQPQQMCRPWQSMTNLGGVKVVGAATVNQQTTGPGKPHYPWHSQRGSDSVADGEPQGGNETPRVAGDDTTPRSTHYSWYSGLDDTPPSSLPMSVTSPQDKVRAHGTTPKPKYTQYNHVQPVLPQLLTFNDLVKGTQKHASDGLKPVYCVDEHKSVIAKVSNEKQSHDFVGVESMSDKSDGQNCHRDEPRYAADQMQCQAINLERNGAQSTTNGHSAAVKGVLTGHHGRLSSRRHGKRLKRQGSLRNSFSRAPVPPVRHYAVRRCGSRSYQIIPSSESSTVHPLLVQCWASVADNGPNIEPTMGHYHFTHVCFQKINLHKLNHETFSRCWSNVGPVLQTQH